MITQSDFHINIGTNSDTDVSVVLSEDNRFLHEILVGSNEYDVIDCAALPRIEQDVEKLASGHPAGVFVLSEKHELINNVLLMTHKHRVPSHLIHDLTPVLSDLNNRPEVSAIISMVMKQGGIVLVSTGDSGDLFFRTKITNLFLEHFEANTFKRPPENRIPVFLTIQSSTISSNALLGIFTRGRSYHVGVSLLLVNNLNPFPDTNYRQTILMNAATLTCYQLLDQQEIQSFEDHLGVTPRFLSSECFEQGNAYCRYVDPVKGGRTTVLIKSKSAD